MNYLGISCKHHDAALSIIDDCGNISFAGHSERYSKIKNDKNLNIDLLRNSLNYCSDNFEIHYYENSFVKYLRQKLSGEKTEFANILPHTNIGLQNLKLLEKFNITNHNHHLSHAAAGFQTSPFEEATVVIIDAIGEFDTISIYSAKYINDIATYKKIWSLKYPDSIGLFYSAMTHRVDLKPNEEEYILMGMSAYGSNEAYAELYEAIIEDSDKLKFRSSLHKGVSKSFLFDYNNFEISKASQMLLEYLVDIVMRKAKLLNASENLVYGGGVALNCLANRLLGNYYKSIWIMPNPGDAGSSLGAAALGYKKRVNWNNAYLGYNIAGEYPVDSLISTLQKEKIVGVASGRAEFGPRALGNRSLLADPRGADIKDRVNVIKQRQKFRPFAPVILEEFVDDFFELPKNWPTSRYMQVVAKCKFPEIYPAITHVDGTSRVQTVPKDNSGIRKLLEEWYIKTGSPMLLNTSLNIRGYPMVNDETDKLLFQKQYSVQVF